MNDGFAPERHPPAGGPDDPSARILRQAIEHVDRLLERLDRGSPAPPERADRAERADPVGRADHAAAPGFGLDGTSAVRLAAAVAELSGPLGAQAQAFDRAVQVILLARDAAERVRAQAYRASMAAALNSGRLLHDAVRAAAALQADAQRTWAECEAWASEQSRVADEAIRTLLAGSALDRSETDSVGSNPPNDTVAAPAESVAVAEAEQAVQAAVGEVDGLRTDHRGGPASR